MVFTVPYHLGIDCVGWVDWMEKKNWMEWTKSVNVDSGALIQRVYNNDDFTVWQPAWWNKQTVRFWAHILTFKLTNVQFFVKISNFS